MITIPRNDNYISVHLGETYPCAICGKPCPDPKYMLHEHDGGGIAVTEEEAAKLDESGDLGMQPIGVSCFKKHPELKPYVVSVAPKKVKAPKKPSVNWKDLYFDLYRQAMGEGAPDEEILEDAKKRRKLLS